MNLDNLKRFESETIITQEYAVIVERTGRGSVATVADAASEFNGLSAFASTPSAALATLMNKVAQLQTA